ncbi:MAG: ATPase, T2SS/T4P/T4SS family [Phycisphaerae bacterium]|jgi:type II secretory ATPase GspE/PulE/Tfp pilus assembly ATPase PilB-like protein
MPERLYSTYQVADLIGATPGAVVEWVQKGLLPVQRLPEGALRVPETGLVQFLKTRGLDSDQIAAKLRNGPDKIALQVRKDAAVVPQSPRPVAGPAVMERDPRQAPHNAMPMVPSEDQAPPRPAAQKTTVADRAQAAPRAARPAAPSPDPAEEMEVTTAEKLQLAGLRCPDDSRLSDEENEPSRPLEREDDAETPNEQAPDEPTPLTEEADAAPLTPEPEVREEEVARTSAEVAELATAPLDIEEMVLAPEDLPQPAAEAPAPVEAVPPPPPSPARVAQRPAPGRAEMPKAMVSPLAQAAQQIISEARNQRASDIHLEVFASGSRIRLRIDGFLYPRPGAALSAEAAGQLIGYFKSLAALNPAERGFVAGGFSMTVGGQSLALKLSTLPIVGGQRMVISAPVEEPVVGLEALGLSIPMRLRLARLLAQPGGMILLACRAGKERSAAVRAIVSAMDGGRSVVAVPSPVHAARMPLSVTADMQDLSVAQAVAGLARQDVDAIVVEDPRDDETVAAMLDATDAGRLVLAAVGEGDLASAIGDLLETAEPERLARSLCAAIAFTQVRRLCPDCRVPAQPSGDSLELLGRQDLGFEPFGPGKCDRCHQRGYDGLAGLSASVFIDRPLQTILRKAPAAAELADAMRRSGVISLPEAGLELARAGTTTLEELVRVLPE